MNLEDSRNGLSDSLVGHGLTLGARSHRPQNAVAQGLTGARPHTSRRKESGNLVPARPGATKLPEERAELGNYALHRASSQRTFQGGRKPIRFRQR